MLLPLIVVALVSIVDAQGFGSFGGSAFPGGGFPFPGMGFPGGMPSLGQFGSSFPALGMGSFGGFGQGSVPGFGTATGMGSFGTGPGLITGMMGSG
ncbi:unnamed protein product [Heligmosomoides polygyrus]|uniref:Glycine rich superfamily member n=1 Tax=Heligmosomoides polygyrus TaxID=6339 RepID=A0A183GF16_HELPZ|nr:unnamed protein product [Heligmosomoides polygyrus]